ncbi:MAG: serine hydrolase [Chloroflexi bacterium]|nr:serine hydrolase [Chloroflexota bacterium]
MPARLFAVGLLALLLAACSGASTPPPTSTPAATETPPPPTETPIPPPTTVLVTPLVWLGEDDRCADPYPQGAPYEPLPGQPILLRPVGKPPELAPYQPLTFTADPALEQVVRQSVGDDEAHIAVVVKNLADGRGAALAGERSFYSASLYKIWVLLETYRHREAGLLDFDERYIISDYYEDEFVLNEGELAACDEVTLGEVVDQMIRVSGNVAALFVLDRVGMDNVNETLRDLGLEVSRYRPDSLPTTAAEMALLMEMIARRQAVSETASDEMLALLSDTYFNDRLPALLPEGTRVAHKTGSWSNASHDAGIVYSPAATYVIVVLTDFGYSDEGTAAIARISRAVYDYYNGS